MLLEAKDLTVYYGAVQALNRINLRVNYGEIVAIVGPNGAGKSTALKAICGLLESTNGEIAAGDVFFTGGSIKNIPPHKLVKMGICLVPQGRRIFQSMSVFENLEMGAFTQKDNRKITRALQKVFNLFPILEERQNQQAGTLSGGEQQMLAIGRALMLQPKLLLLDEPSLGLSPNYVRDVFEKMKEITKEGTALMIVEQNAHSALEVASRGYIFRTGEIFLEGPTEELLKVKTQDLI